MNPLFNEISKGVLKKSPQLSALRTLLTKSHSDNRIPGVLKEHYHQWMQTLSPMEKHAIRLYTSEDYFMINHHLRNAPQTPPAHRTKADHLSKLLHSALSKSSLPIDVTVHRWTSREIFQGFALDRPQALSGRKFSESGFLSTSLEQYGFIDANNFDVYLKIHAPKGAKGAFIEDLSLLGHEKEILFDKGQTLQIKKVQSIDNKLHVDCHLLLDS